MDIRIMTSNIWGDYFGNEVAHREDQLFEVYSKYAPDVIGMQEVTKSWHDSTLMSNMQANGYLLLDDAPIGVNNFNVMFVKASRFTVRRGGFEQMTHTEDSSKNMQWAILIDKETDVRIGVCNAQFEYRGGPKYDEAREFNAEQMAWRMNYLLEQGKCVAAFGFGDMNTSLISTVFPTYEKRGITHLATQAPEMPTFSSYHGYPVRGEDGFYHGKAPESSFKRSLDHIVGKGNYTVKNYEIVTDRPALDATDHSPVFVDVTV